MIGGQHLSSSCKGLSSSPSGMRTSSHGSPLRASQMKRPPGSDLYIMQMGRTGAIKVGRSSNVDRRLTEIQTGCPYEVRVIIVAKDQGWRERSIHQDLRRFRLRGHKGEWFSEMSLGSLPDAIYELMDLEMLEMVNGEWWKACRDPGPHG